MHLTFFVNSIYQVDLYSHRIGQVCRLCHSHLDMIWQGSYRDTMSKRYQWAQENVTKYCIAYQSGISVIHRTSIYTEKHYFSIINSCVLSLTKLRRLLLWAFGGCMEDVEDDDGSGGSKRRGRRSREEAERLLWRPHQRASNTQLLRPLKNALPKSTFQISHFCRYILSLAHHTLSLIKISNHKTK